MTKSQAFIVVIFWMIFSLVCYFGGKAIGYKDGFANGTKCTINLSPGDYKNMVILGDVCLK